MKDYTISQAAKKIGCHRNTILNYEKMDYIKSFRDHNNFRRYTEEQINKLKEIFEIRTR